MKDFAENKINDTSIDTVLIDSIEALLPQTQCTKCGFQGCRPYATAISQGTPYNQCPVGGQAGIDKLAEFLQKPSIALNPEHGQERVRHIAKIDPEQCIGCTLCIQACPVDAIVGSSKYLHVVLEDDCTGCDLCLVPCPVDCISMHPVDEPTQTAWLSWSNQQAQTSKMRYQLRNVRLTLEKQALEQRLAENQAKKQAVKTQQIQQTELQTQQANHLDKQAMIKAAIERAKQRVISES